MIHSFTFKNFYSFAEKGEVSFVVNKNTPDEGYAFTEMGEKVSKVLAVVGNNASGKTTVLKVLPFMKWIVVDSFNYDPSKNIPIKPFLSEETEGQPTELSVDFEMKGKLYTYRFILTEERILEEELKVKNISKERLSTKNLFFRKWNRNTKMYEFIINRFELPKNFENTLRKNASVISLGMRLNHQFSEEIGKYWEKVVSNVLESGWIGDLNPKFGMEFIEAFNFFSDPKNEKIKKKAEKMLKKYDLGVSGFNIVKDLRDAQVSFTAEISHEYSPGKQIPFQHESAGTKRLLVILKNILVVLENGGAAIIDEFDVSLHPQITTDLFKKFSSVEENKHHAQLVFSTHNHDILNELDKYQILFTEKEKNGGSFAWKLADMKGVRGDDDFAAKYRAGAYGAVPNIR